MTTHVAERPIRDFDVRDYRRFPFHSDEDLPELSQIQTKPYHEFLQYNAHPGNRKNSGLEGLFRDVFPIESHDKSMSLDYQGYTLGRPRYTPDECRELRHTYAYPLKVRLALRKGSESVEEEIYLGEVPVMRGGGEFIVNGSERVIVTQMHRSPGIDFSVEQLAGDKRYHSARIIPERGSWVELSVSKKGMLQVRIDQQGKFSALTFLRALNEEWGETASLLRLFYPTESISRAKRTKGKFAKELEGRIAVAPVHDARTGEIWAEAGHVLTAEAAEMIAASDMKSVEVLASVEDSLVLDSLKEDAATDNQTALEAIYQKLRPGNPVQAEKARELLQDRFFDPQRYSLGKVGRFRINRKFERVDAADAHTTLLPEDYLDTIHYLLGLRRGEGEIDDIDHLGNRRVRTIRELATEEFRKGLIKVKRAILDRMSQQSDTETLTPRTLINAKAFSTSVDQFYARSELSQVVDQTNPLSQLTHERRLSALGPGGLNRKRAGFQERDVHISHYGRLCPIETPEGANIGLISSLSLFSVVDDYGFLATPYRKVKRGKVTDEIALLRADEEYNVVFAPADSELDDKKRIKVDESGHVMARSHGEFALTALNDIEYLDIAPNQILGVSSALIPFVEHDDANRALMGSNMQRQAVPLLTTEPPLVATGLERMVAHNSGMVVKARQAGRVAYVDAKRIEIEKDPEPYLLRKFRGLNEKTCLTQKPLVRVGQVVKTGEVLADGAGTSNGELALGKNLLVAFMSWEGYNYEDAIVVSERLVHEDAFTSIHIEEYEVEIRETTLGKEEFTRDIPNAGERALKNLDENGLVQIGTRVGPNDILVGKIAPKSKTELSPEERLLHAIFGRAGEDVKNVSLKLPAGVHGMVVAAERYSRKVNMTAAERREAHEKIREIEAEYDAVLRSSLELCLEEIQDYLDVKIVDPETKKPIAITEATLFGDLTRLFVHLEEYAAGIAGGRRPKAVSIVRSHKERVEDKEAWKTKMSNKYSRGDDLPNGVLEMVKVYLATKRNLSVGDKMAGRHGNKGVISRILPVEDMPYTEDGTPVDILLNPLGVPSRMNVGQILETHLGLAAHHSGFRAVTGSFDGAREADIEAALEEAGLPRSGAMPLRDGRTGQAFEQDVTVGYMYMLKLHHLVDEKVHARSTGPYSLITQQPLGGKARFGGQRFGEMEVWALEAYGAAYLLQEMLTVKSDDVDGRTKIYESMVKGKNVLEADTPVSFEVLMNEIKGLGLNIKLDTASRI